ncbi:hypothetical protein ACFQZ4_04345 [Catellatospora coxensis]|uniref:Uncharacterized protein n=1 Tax=Catellatospora coxensis TaxID=310354 RepID=A0A8J3P6V9_9ACTN|nr:hypothetical protein [Catellatospora coxensis]GIG06271.1 hypothetical protein Cco03nite_29710 [Catellatospora coxensis]
MRDGLERFSDGRTRTRSGEPRRGASPTAKDYLVSDSYLQAPLTSTLCVAETVRPDNINAQLRLDGGSGSGQITLDSLDFRVTTTRLLPCPH